MSQVRGFMNDGLRLKFRVHITRNCCAIWEGAWHPKISAKTNQHHRSAGQTITIGIAIDYESPKVRLTLRTATRIPEFVTGN
jgi:hypothetical protein